MSKCVITLGWWKTFVMDADKALALMEILGKAEQHDTKWKDDTKIHYVYPHDLELSMSYLSDEAYRMGKLAGKPE